MKAFITKYALTQGILELEVTTLISDTMIGTPGRYGEIYYHKPFWYTNKPDAIKHAGELRQGAIASATRKLKKLEALEF